MKLTIISVDINDFGMYKCVARNSLGETDGTIKLYSKYGVTIHCTYFALHNMCTSCAFLQIDALHVIVSQICNPRTQSKKYILFLT